MGSIKNTDIHMPFESLLDAHLNHTATHSNFTKNIPLNIIQLAVYCYDNKNSILVFVHI